MVTEWEISVMLLDAIWCWFRVRNRNLLYGLASRATPPEKPLSAGGVTGSGDRAVRLPALRSLQYTESVLKIHRGLALERHASSEMLRD